MKSCLALTFMVLACGGLPDAEVAEVADVADGPAATEHEPGRLRATRTVLLVPGTLITGGWFDTMSTRLRRDGYEPVVFVPPDLFTESLVIGAGRIRDEVQRVLAARGETRLHIIAECDGGVATRYYLQFLGGDQHVDQVVTMVSAHHGTWESPLGYWFTGFQALKDIEPGSPFMKKLNGVGLPSGLKLTSIYSCWDEFMVPYWTSAVDGANNVRFCDRYIGHFDVFWDDVVYARARAALEGRGESMGDSF